LGVSTTSYRPLSTSVLRTTSPKPGEEVTINTESAMVKVYHGLEMQASKMGYRINRTIKILRWRKGQLLLKLDESPIQFR
jgi:hypothetical protein